jgi:hypothetical protein
MYILQNAAWDLIHKGSVSPSFIIDMYEYVTVRMLLMRKCGDSGGMRHIMLIKSQMHCTTLRLSTTTIQRVISIYVKQLV